MSIVINFISGPGGGKSTMAARVFSELKERGYNAEIVTEYAKHLTWSEGFRTLGNQIYVFGKQHHKMWILRDKVDFIITDSPLPLTIYYGGEGVSESFKNLVKEEYEKYKNIDIFLKRTKAYNPKGRNQTLEEAKIIDNELYLLMQGFKGNSKPFDLELDGKAESSIEIIDYILNGKI